MKNLGLGLLVIGLIVVRFYTTRTTFTNLDSVRITTRVISEPIKYSTSQYLKIMGLTTFLPVVPEIGYGDTITVEGRVEDNQLINPKIMAVKPSQGILTTFREKLLTFYRQGLPQPHASLVAGVVLGQKSGLPNSFWQALQQTGTAHVVVASGMNVTLVAGGVLSLLLVFLKRRQAIMISIIIIWMYALMCGFDAPIVRAAIMGTLAFGAVGLGRINQSFRALVIAAGVMLLVKPDWLLDLGFWLSFVATLSLMLFQPGVQKRLQFVPQVFRENLATSLAAQIGVTPILYFTFGYINILSPIINALVLWTIAPITIIGMVSGIVGIVVEPVGRLILYLTFPLTWWFVSAVQLFSA